MGDVNSVRRSGRERKPNKKYTVDAFEGLNILSSDSEAAAEVLQEDASDDDDFAFDGVEEVVGGPEEDEITEEGGSEGSGIVSPAGDYEGASSYASGVDASEHERSHGGEPLVLGSFSELPSFRPRKNLWKKEQNSHARGVLEPTQYASKEYNLKYMFGTGTEDILNIVRARDMWAGPITLPSKVADAYGSRGMEYPFSHTTQKREMESTIGWNWYYEHGGRVLFEKRQKTQVLHIDKAKSYMPTALNNSHSCLMGPYGKQQVYDLAVMQSMHIGEPWKHATDAESENTQGRSRKGGREGWILNLGSSVRCLDWAPNHSSGTQYLALVTSPKPSTAQTPMSAAPSFTPLYPLPAAIQIWAFAATTDADRTGHVDQNKLPELILTICTDWGAVKQLKWCPIPRVPRDDEVRGKVSLGLLAGIWGDGHVRVLDIQIDRVNGPSASCGMLPPEHNLRFTVWLTLPFAKPNTKGLPLQRGRLIPCVLASHGCQRSISPLAAQTVLLPFGISPKATRLHRLTMLVRLYLLRHYCQYQCPGSISKCTKHTYSQWHLRTPLILTF